MHRPARLGRVSCSCAFLVLSLAIIGHAPAAAQGTCSAQPRGIVAWYPGDGNTKDFAGPGVGTIVGNAAFAAGQVGQGFLFDGNQDGVNVGNPGRLQLQNFTIEAWVRRASATESTLDSPDVGLVFGYGLNGYALYIRDDGRLGFGKVGVSEVGSWSARVTDTNLHHVAVTKTGTTVKLYVDGVVNETYYDTSFEFTTNAAVGARGDTFLNSFNGLVDEVVVYDRALSLQEILAQHAGGSAGKCKESRVWFSSPTYSNGETSGPFAVTVRRTGDASAASTVSYATADGTATAGQDYTATSGSLTFAPGEFEKPLAVMVADDGANEPDETLHLSLSAPTGAVLGSAPTALLTIHHTPAGPGRIIVTGGNLYTHALYAYNTDGSNGIQLTPLRYGTHALSPSVARLTGQIAFAACGDYPAADCSKGYRIFVMNGDGTGRRQVTSPGGLSSPTYQQDTQPVISPDGSKVAFLSGRPPAAWNRHEIFVARTDGTGAPTIITTHQNPGTSDESYALSAAWSPDSSKLLVHAFRQIPGSATLVGSLFLYNADGSGETLLVPSVSNAWQGSIAIDWSPDGRHILYATKGGPYHVTYGYVVADALDPTLDYTYLDLPTLVGSNGAVTGDQATVRFSPDGHRIVYGATGPGSGSTTGGSVRTIGIDGSSPANARVNADDYAVEKWWWPGQALAAASRLELTPNPALVWQGSGVTLLPTLYDASDGVIFHAAQWDADYSLAGNGYQCGAPHPSCVGSVFPRVDAFGTVLASTGNGEINWCASNAGKSACARIRNYDTPVVSVTASTPAASRAGTPGRFTLTQVGRETDSIVLEFALGGTAVLGTDYTLDVTGGVLSGNTITTTPNLGAFSVNVRGQATGGGSGPETVIFTLKASTANAYLVGPGAGTATVTLADDAPPPGAITLSNVSPSTGGDNGRLRVTVTGENIAPGATMRLTRSGEFDIAGEGTLVAEDGRSLSVDLDLRSRQHGAWSVVVTNPDGTSAVLPDAFTVASGSWSVWTDVVGRFTMRSGREQTFYLVYGNSGTQDAPATKLVLTLPTKLFYVRGIPEAPVGSPAFVTNHGEQTTYEMYVPSVPAGSAITVPFRLQATGFHTEFDMEVSALTSASLASAIRPIDPAATLSASVSGRTGSTTSMNVTLSGGGNTMVTPATSSAMAASVEEDATITITQMEGVVDLRFRGTIVRPPMAAPIAGAVSAADLLPGEVQESMSVGAQLPGVVGADGTVGTNYVNTAGNLVSTANAAASVDDRYAINDYLFTHDVPGMAGGLTPMAEPSEVENLNGLASAPVVMNALGTVASLPGSPVDAVSGGSLQAFTGVVDGAWAKKIYNLYTSNTDWMTNPNWRGPRDFPLTQDELIIRLTLEAQKARLQRKRQRGTTLSSFDPNDKVGPQGSGTARFINGVDPVTYVVYFENKPEASAAAQDVVVTDQIDPTKFELGTFALGPITVGTRVITPPSNLSQWTTTVDLRPGKDLILKIVAGIDANTGLASWTFTSLDPATMLPTTDPVAGFLPPNLAPPAGEGSVVFTIAPKASLTTGTEISNQARIVFDANAPIDTPVWRNTIDKSQPTSQVSALPATQTSTSFPVSWGGSDTGSGIAEYDVYVSEDGGPFARWLMGTDVTSARYAGNPGKAYGFHSVARDGAGNEQPRPTAPQATTFVAAATSPEDADGDGLPDSWETRYGLNPATAVGLNGSDGDADQDGRTNAQEYQDVTHPRGAFVRYFAEGATSPFFSTSLAIANPSETTAAIASVRFLRSDGVAVPTLVTVPAGGRATIDAGALPGLERAEFATVIESDLPVVADRTMQWDASAYGSHAESSLPGPRTTWYLAEGATHSGFDLFYLVLNPNPSATAVEITYLLPAPAAPIVKSYIVAGNSRFNIWVNADDARLATTDVSAVITSALPVIVERAMYLNSGGLLFAAGHDSAGVTNPATSWFLAEGATGDYFDLFVLIANPTDAQASVEAKYLLPSGSTLVRRYQVAPKSRFNIWVDLEDPALANTAVSTTITSTNGVPIIVERTMWWPGTGWQEAHNSPGSTVTGTKWGLAEGEVGGPSARETYILVANTSAAAGSVRVTLLFDDGTTATRTFAVQANSRFNVAVASEFPESAGRRFGATVESLGAAPAQIVVERAMYWNAGGRPWAAGTNAQATKLR